MTKCFILHIATVPVIKGCAHLRKLGRESFLLFNSDMLQIHNKGKNDFDMM